MNNLKNFDEQENMIPRLKSMSLYEKELLAVEIRDYLIESMNKSGGHLASNLGIVELTLALHSVFDSPKDKIVWDVGHQCYVHKILTGRREEMPSIRAFGGISGFPKRAESVHDSFDSGHSGSSISAALGYAKVRDLAGEDYACIAIIGDGSLTAGVALEALNAAGSMGIPLIVILNDNEMSISENIGGMAKHLQKLRTSSQYLTFKKGVRNILSHTPKIEAGMEKFRDALKYTLVPSAIFEELGFKYFGPIDGHDIEELIDALKVAKALKRPVLIHAITRKGKGHFEAERYPCRYHSVSPNCSKVDTGSKEAESDNGKPGAKNPTYSEVFGSKILELAKRDEKVVAITAAMTEATGLLPMKERFPERVVDVGIAEQHAVSFAAGLALAGAKPVVAIYSTFLQRAYDQIVTEICLQGLPVVFAVDRAGNSGSDGETHHGLFDIAYLSSIPGLTLLAPKDGRELGEMLEYAIDAGTPHAIRYPKGEAADLSFYGRSGFSGSLEKLKTGDGFAFLAAGSMVKTAVKASNILARRGIGAGVYNLRFLSPLNTEEIREVAAKHRRIITLEDGILDGGIGIRIAAILGKSPCQVYAMGWPNKFLEHGSIEELEDAYGLSAEKVAKTAEAFFES